MALGRLCHAAVVHRYTITTKPLRASWPVREQGYAVAVDELEIGLTAVAAPIRNAHGDVVASMSVSGPSFRLDAGGSDEVADPVLGGGLEVSHRLGWGHRIAVTPRRGLP